MLEFYRLGQACSRVIPWLDQHLHLSKYLSSVLCHLRSSRRQHGQLDAPSRCEAQVNVFCRELLGRLLEHPPSNYFQTLGVNLLDDIGRYFSGDSKVVECLTGFTGDPTRAYQISRILFYLKYDPLEAGTGRVYE